MIAASLLVALALQANEMPDSISANKNLAEAQVVANRHTASESSVPSTVVRAEEMQQRGLTSLTEALRTMAGVSVKDYGGIGGLKTVSLRNFGAAHTGIAVDGIVVSNTQSGQVDISRYNLDGLAAVSVEKAGSDDLMRPARLHSAVGTVALVSQRPQLDSASTRVTAQVRTGSFMTWQPYARVEQRLSSRWTSQAWASGTYSSSNYPFTYQNGALQVSDRRQNSQVLSGVGEVDAYGFMGNEGLLTIKAQGYGGSRGLPGSVVLYADNAKEHLWDAGALVAVQYKGEKQRRNKKEEIRNNSQSSIFHFQFSATYNYSWNRYLNPDIIYKEPQEDRYHNHEGAFSGVVQWMPLPCFSASIAQDFALAGLVVGHRPQATDEFARFSSYTALSARYRTDRFTATASALMLCAKEYAGVGESAPARYRLSPEVSVSYRLLQHHDWRIRASFKESYRLPTFTDLYYQRVGNRNLRPERALQTNLGTTYSADFSGHMLNLSADGYYNMVRDKITAIPTLWVWRMRNIGRVQMAGHDLSANYKTPRWKLSTVNSQLSTFNYQLSFGLNYSYQYAVDITDPAAKNYRHQIPYTPRHTFSGHFTLLTSWFTLTYQLTAASARYSLAQNLPAYRLAPYADHALSLNHTFSLPQGALHVSAEALNLAGCNYEIIQYYPMPGRQYRATLRWEL